MSAPARSAPRAGRRSAALDVLAATLRHAAGVVAGIVTVALVARRLGDAALGYWSVLGTASFLLGVADLGLSSAIQRALARDDRARAATLLRAALPLVLVVASALGLLAVLLLPPARGLDPADVRRATALVLFAGVAGAYAFPFRATVLVSVGTRPLGLARALGATVQIVATVLGLRLAPSLTACALALLLGLATETALTVAAARELDPSAPRWPSRGLGPAARATLREGLREGAPSLVVNLAVLAAIRVDLFVLGRVADLPTLAGYAVAARAVDQSWVLAKQASTALLPKLGAGATRAEAVRSGTALLGTVVMAGMPALALAGGPLLRAWAGPSGASSVAHVTLLLLGAAAMVASLHEVSASALALGAKSPWGAGVPLLVGALVNLCLALALARPLGAYAVAGSTLVGNLVTAALVLRGVRAMLGLEVAALARMLAAPASAALASVAIVELFGQLGRLGLLGSGADKAGGALVVCALACLGGVLAGLVAMRAAYASASRASRAAALSTGSLAASAASSAREAPLAVGAR